MSELSDTEAGRLFETASTWAEIDLDAIRGNIAAVIAAASPDAAAGEPVTDRRPAVMAVVKANGYGHGAVEVARAALDGGATWLGVARAEEALVLRAAGVDAPLLLLGYVPPDAVPAMVAHEVSLTLWSAEQIRAVAAQLTGTDAGVPARIHLKIDTGMRRIGCPPAQARPLLELVAELAAAGAPLRAEGVFTHFACADSADKTIAGEQLAAFGAAVDELTAAGLRPPLVHAANSAATITMPAARFDMVRYGIALYGLLPGPAVTLPAGTRPALTWRAVLSRVTEVPAGQGVGYGHTYRTGSHPERIGTVPVGYADGWRRIDGNEVLVGGRRVPVVGRVCMDQFMVDLDGVPEAVEGDEVVLIGRQGEDRITADDVAERWGTIGYEVVCGLGARVPRYHLSGTTGPAGH